MTLLSLGAWSAYAQESAPKDEAAASESKAETAVSSTEKTAESAASSSENVDETASEVASSPELTADEARDAELEAKKEEEDASRRAKNDADALKVFQKGLDLEREGEYRKAAKRYLDAELLTSDKTVKANALTNAARAYRQAELY
ncbi:MAG: hypothetical protein IJ980_05195, partial [Oscillospiraceae bacterium]|nr:hypothetical protein [Oscillospiraceae bacterium]